MDNPLSSGWVQLDLIELIRVSIENDNVRVAWIGHQYKQSPEHLLALCDLIEVKARQLKVSTREVWQNKIDNSGYVVDYHDGNGNPANVMTDSKAVHYTLQQYGDKYGAEYSNNPKYRSKTRDILVSAYDTFKNKRVIVDGIHRAAVMSSTYSDDSDYSNRIVYEWYGDKVNELFPYDFKPFYRSNAHSSTS